MSTPFLFPAIKFLSRYFLHPAAEVFNRIYAAWFDHTLRDQRWFSIIKEKTAKTLTNGLSLNQNNLYVANF